MEIQTGKEDVELLLFTDDLIVYITVATNSIREFLQPINNLSKVTGYKISSKNQ